MADLEKVSNWDNSSEISKIFQSTSSKTLFSSANYEQSDAFYGKLTIRTGMRAVSFDRTSKEGFIIKKTCVD
jgi:hypothetical protein